MDTGISFSGNVEIGWVSAPLATLSASATSLSISVPVIGSYRFGPEQVVGLEPYGGFPFIGKGIRIVHTRPDCPARIIFRCFHSPDRILDDVRLAGFLPRASSAGVPKRDGMPVRWPPVVTLIVLWNTLFLLDGYVPWNAPRAPGRFVFLALALVFATALAVERSAAAQSWVLKPGRAVGEIRPYLRLFQSVSGPMLGFLTVFALLGSRR